MWVTVSTLDQGVMGPFTSKEQAERWVEAQKKYPALMDGDKVEGWRVQILNSVGPEDSW